MMPWNPIHRYAGLNSSYTPFGDDPSRRPGVVPGYARGAGGGSPADGGRRPLGFVDVRDESPLAGGHESERGGDAAFAGQAGQEPVATGSAFAAAAPEPDAETAKTPFYKREISFGRKKKERPEIPAAAAESTPPESGETGEKSDRVPFYKREIGFRRRQDESTAEPAETREDEETVAAADPEPTDPEHLDPEHLDPEHLDPEHLEPEPGELVASADPENLEPAVAADESEPVAAPESPVERDDLPLEWPDEDAAAAAEPPAAEPPAAEPPQAEDTAPVPAATPAAAVPLRKRQLSLGRPRGRKTSPGGGRNGARRSGQKVVGLKIGASQLAAAVVQEHEGRLELVELARTPLEPGIVVDGEVRDADALTHALNAFFAEHKLPTRDVRIGLSSNRIGVRTFEMAGVEDESRFDNAVRFKAHEVLPIGVNESVLDYRVLEERRSELGETSRRILLVVAPRDQVTPYAEVAERAGLKLAGIDLEALGLLRTFVEPQAPGARKATDTATVVVAIGHEASTLLVSGGGVCEFTRVFDWGGSALQEAIAQELHVLPVEAGTILRHLSLSGSSPRIEGVDEEARGRALDAVRLRLTPFARELVSSLQFYQTQPDSLGIGEIVITGGASQLDGLAEALHQMIGVAVRVGDPLQRLAVRKGVDAGFEKVIGSLSVAVGLAIDDEAVRGVDLTPRDLAKDAKRLPRLLPILLPAGAAIPVAALGLLFFQAHGQVSDRQSRLAQLQVELARMPQPKVPQIDASLRGAQAQRASAVAQVLGARPTWDAVLGDFSRVLPANVWLTTLQAKTSRPLSTAVATTAAVPWSQKGPANSAPAAAPSGVTIVGYTYSQADVADLLARLSALPSLQNVQLQQSNAVTIGKKDVVQFTILADMREGGGGA